MITPSCWTRLSRKSADLTAATRSGSEAFQVGHNRFQKRFSAWGSQAGAWEPSTAGLVARVPKLGLGTEGGAWEPGGNGAWERGGRQSDTARLVLILLGGEVAEELLDERLRLGQDADLVFFNLGLAGHLRDSVFNPAELVHQAEVEGLLAGKRAAAGQFVDVLLQPIAADRHDVGLEVAVDFLSINASPAALRVAGNLARAEHAWSAPASYTASRRRRSCPTFPSWRTSR